MSSKPSHISVIRIAMNNKGQSLLEVIVAMAIFALISAAMITLSLGGFTALEQGGEHTEAKALAQEGIEAVRAIRDSAWNELIYTTSSVSVSSTQWVFDGEDSIETIGQYTRTISFSDVCRDVSDDIAVCPGDYTDIHSKKVSSVVTWEVRPGVSNSVQQFGYLTNWDTKLWPQTDWSGGSGQSIWSSITRYDSASGIVDVNSGQVVLDQTTDTSASTTWPFDISEDYTYSTTSIEVVNDFAQLVGATGSLGGTIDDGFENTTDTSYDWPFSTAGNYTFPTSSVEVTGGVGRLIDFGGGGSSGDTVNPDFDIDSSNWTYNDWEFASKVNGSRESSGGNPNGYINVVVTKNKNSSISGFWEQSFVTDVDNPTIATTTFDWLVSQYSSSFVTSFQLYVFVDSISGDPTVGQQVWSSGEITSTTSWASVPEIDISSKLGTAGTYYLKTAVRVITGGGGGPTSGTNTGGFDNINLYWEGGGGSSYVIDEPEIYPTSSYSAIGVQSWDSFTETAIKNGGEIYYQLSYDDGANWYFWNATLWMLAGASDYNTASVINTNILSFITSTEQIKLKAFLQSDGTQQVQLDNINLGLTPSPVVWSFANWDVGGGEVAPVGVRQTDGGNLNNYADITIPSGNSDSVGGYWQQEFVTTEDNPVVSIDFDYKTIDFNGLPDMSQIRVYVDTATGDPVNQVGSGINISAVGDWTTSTQIDATSAVTTAGTYYLKIAYWVETDGGGEVGPFTVGFDNVNLVWDSASYPNDSPTISNSESFIPSAVASWTGFVESAVKNGGEIYYQLSNDDGSTWQYWNGSAWSTATASSTSNTASVVNSAISYFDTTAKKLMFKAFLASDGYQLVKLDNIVLQYEVADVAYYGNQFVVGNISGAGPLSNASKMTSLRFTASGDNTVSGARVYLEQSQGVSPVYRYGIQSDVSGEPSGVWLGATNQGYGDYQSLAVGWQSIILNEGVVLTQDTVYHLVIEHQSGTVNGGNNIELRRSDPINLLRAYDSSADVQSNILFSEDSGINWTVQNYQPIYLLDFIDITYEGNPYHEVVQNEIYGDNYFGQQFLVTGSDIMVSTVGMDVSENNQGPQADLILGFYNVTGGVLLATSTLTTSDQIANGSYSWQEFFFDQPLTLSSGNTYRIYISAPDADVTAHYLIRSAFHDSSSIFNSANYNGTNSFYISSIDGGDSWDTTGIHQDLVGFRFQQTIFNTEGYLVSSAYNSGVPSAFNVIEWNQVTPSCSPNCEVKLQIQTAPNNAGSPGDWSATWCGPDGEDGDDTDYFTDNAGQLIHTDHNEDQWIRYKATLVGDSIDTPVLEKTLIYYQ